MSPSAGKDHGDQQAEIVYQLKLLLPKGGVLTECGVSTQAGNKTPDISWISIRQVTQRLFLTRPPSYERLSHVSGRLFELNLFCY